MKAERVIYYSDPLHDDFAGTKINTCTLGEDFPLVRRGPVWRILAFVVYYLIAIPLVWLMAKLFLGLKFENRRVLRQLRGTAFFLYGNHTQVLDAYVPPLAAFPKRAYTVAGPDAVSIPGIRRLVMLLGALPIPTERSAMRGFLEAVSIRCREKACVAVYPEAHIWPYYTGIRPFPDTSFHYPVKENVPAVAMVTTYRKRRGLFRLCKRPGMTVTFSQPMYPDQALHPRKAQTELRDRVFAFMAGTATERNQVQYIRYEPIPQSTDERKNAHV